MTHTATKPNSLAIGAFGFALMTGFWPGIAGAATTPRWDIAALLAIAMVVQPRVWMTPAHIFGMMLVAWLLLSVTWAGTGWLDGVDQCFKLVLIAIAFAVGSNLRRIDALIIGCAIGLSVSSVVAIAQWFGWDGIEHSRAIPSGLFFNEGRMGAAAAMVMVGLVALRRWSLLPLVAPALVLSGSRAAWLAVAFGAFEATRRMEKPRQVLLLGLIALGLTCGIVAKLTDVDGGGRLIIWWDTLKGISFFGHGLGSFREDFLHYASTADLARIDSRPDHPHNEWLWLLFEGGVPALVIGGVFAAIIWKVAAHETRAILSAFFVLSLFAMPLHDPATAILAAVVAGHLVARGELLLDVAFGRRPSLRQGLASALTTSGIE